MSRKMPPAWSSSGGGIPDRGSRMTTGAIAHIPASIGLAEGMDVGSKRRLNGLTRPAETLDIVRRCERLFMSSRGLSQKGCFDTLQPGL